MTNLNLPVGPNIVYKIRRNADGLFSLGGTWPSFSKKGKIWKQKNHLTSHINQLHAGGNARGPGHVYADCEIIPYEIVETPVGTSQSIMDYIADRKWEKKLEADREKLARDASSKKKRKADYDKLKQEFE